MEKGQKIKIKLSNFENEWRRRKRKYTQTNTKKKQGKSHTAIKCELTKLVLNFKNKLEENLWFRDISFNQSTFKH